MVKITYGNKRRKNKRQNKQKDMKTQSARLRIYNIHHKKMKPWLNVLRRILTKCRQYAHKCTVNCRSLRQIVLYHSRTCRLTFCEFCRRRELLFIAHMRKCKVESTNCDVCKEYDKIISEHRLECKDTKYHKICKVCRWRRYMQKEHTELCDMTTCKTKYCVRRRKRALYCQIVDNAEG